MYIFSLARNRVLFGVVLALLIIALFSALHLVPLRAEEPRRAIVALEMLLSGNFISPTINGIFYYNKPPLYNWLLAGLFTLFGSYADWIVRLPSPLFLLLTGGLNYWVVRRYTKSLETALLSSLFYVTSGDILFYFSMLGEIDIFYTFLVYCQVIFIFAGYEQKRWMWLFIGSYFFTAAGLLTKGLPSLAFQGITLLAVAGYKGQWRWLFGVWHFVGIGLLGILAGGYFYEYNSYNSAVTYILKLFTESSQHSALEKTMWGSVEHIATFPLMLAKLLLPWTLALLFVAQNGMWQRIKQQPLLHFSAWFILANVGIYWLSPGTRDRYLYIFLPFLSIIIAYFYAHTPTNNRRHTWFRYIIGGLLALITLIFAALPFVPDLKQLPNLLPISVGFVLIGLGILYLFYRRLFADILLLALGVVVLRWAFNVAVVPTQATTIDQKIYTQSAQKILAITQQQPIYLYGDLHTEHAYFQPMGKVLLDVTYQQPPFLPFQSSFYLSRGNKKIVQCSNEKVPNRYYIANKTTIPTQNTQILHEFYEPRTQTTYVLFRFD
jgi:4-amino-4-deoxy-L-arabinose transferase-like glycosyltransferase